MDRSEVQKCSLILGGGGCFCHQNQSCSKASEMDRSEVKIFPSSWGGGGSFSATKTKVSSKPNCLKWIDLKSKNFPSSWGEGLFCHQNQSCSKLPEMDRSEVKILFFSHPGCGGGGFSATKTKVAWNRLKWIDLKSKFFPSSWGGGLFCHQNQSCSKLSEMDRSEVNNFSLNPGGGGLFLPPKPKLLEIVWNG